MFYILTFEDPISILTCRGKGFRSPDWIGGRNQGEHDQNTGYEILKELKHFKKNAQSGVKGTKLELYGRNDVYIWQHNTVTVVNNTLLYTAK